MSGYQYLQDEDPIEHEEGPSKSKKKREMRHLQSLCDELARTKEEHLSQLNLPESLLDSLDQAARLKSSSARNRQLRHASKILSQDQELITSVESYFEEQKNQARKEQMRHKQIEHWRDRLLDLSENALSDFFDQFPQADRQELSTLVRNARKEKELKKAPAQQRKLFKYLRDQAIS